jgi:hypothetical protein
MQAASRDTNEEEQSMWPELTVGVQAFIRAAYGIFLIGTLVLALRHGRRYFVSERWGGYGQSSPGVDAIQNPWVYPAVMAVWAGAAVLITIGKWTVWAALVNWALCHHYFIRLRWNGLLRGMGAPGFLTNWMACAVFFLEYTQHYAPALRSLALLTLQVDYAFVMMSAGVFKVWSGYAKGRGFEFALANPQWTYWSRIYRRVRPGHWLFKIYNQLAWSSELAVSVLMLLPPVRWIGGLLNIGLFGFIQTHLRLALLCPMAMLCGFVCFGPDTPPGQILEPVGLWLGTSTTPVLEMPALVNQVVRAALWAYLVLLPFAHGGLWLNLYGKKALPGSLQIALEKYTGHFGMIVWRVFSYDVVSFAVMIHEESVKDKERKLISDYETLGGRFNDVGEPLVLTCVFNSLKYYASNRDVFKERLVRYARTLPVANGSRLVFEYLSIQKTETGFTYVPLSEYTVDPVGWSIEETILSKDAPGLATHGDQVAHEGVRPGSYVPLRS